MRASQSVDLTHARKKNNPREKQSEGKTTGALTHATGAAKRRTGLVLVRPEQEYNVICCIMSFFGVLRRYVENGAGASKWVGRDDRIYKSIPCGLT